MKKDNNPPCPVVRGLRKVLRNGPGNLTTIQMLLRGKALQVPNNGFMRKLFNHNPFISGLPILVFTLDKTGSIIVNLSGAEEDSSSIFISL